MAKRGRKPKDPSQKARTRRTRDPEPLATTCKGDVEAQGTVVPPLELLPPGSPEKPAWLYKQAKKVSAIDIWEQAVAEHKNNRNFSKVDRNLLAKYCTWLARAINLEITLGVAANDLVVRHSNNTCAQKQEIKTLITVWEQVSKAHAEIKLALGDQKETESASGAGAPAADRQGPPARDPDEAWIFNGGPRPR